MEKTRVPKGDWYWFIFRTKGGGFVVNCKIEEGSSYDNARFDIGNYFIVKEEALSMARKLRVVLKGADVIEWPSEEEFYKVAPSTDKLGGFSLENRSKVQGFQDCWNWIKSKIVK